MHSYSNLRFPLAVALIFTILFSATTVTAQWKIVPDPAPHSARFSVPDDLMITFPFDKSIPKQVYPARLSPFALQFHYPSPNGVKSTQVEVWDLREPKLVSQFDPMAKDGKVLYKNTKVNPAADAKQVLEFIEKLEKVSTSTVQ